MLKQTVLQGPTCAGRLQSNYREAENTVYDQDAGETVLGAADETEASLHGL